MITDGNWKHTGYDTEGQPVITSNDGTENALVIAVAECGDESSPTLEDAEDNARVLAASKDLLAAMKAMFKECAMIHKYGGDSYNGKQAAAAVKAGRDAIAKAKAVKC